MGQPLYCSVADGGVGRERLWWGLYLLHVTQQYRLASITAQLSSTDISHHNFLPHLPLIHLSTVNSSPCSRNIPQSLNSSSCTFLGTCIPVWGMYGRGKDCLILIPFRLPQISCFSVSLKSFSSDSDNCPNVGIGPLLQFPHPPRAGPVLLTLLFPPGSFLLPSFAWLYIFFSSGQALLSALSWCSACTSVSEGMFLMYTGGERCTPRPPTPPPSCSPPTRQWQRCWVLQGHRVPNLLFILNIALMRFCHSSV